MSAQRRRMSPEDRRELWEIQNRRCGYCGTQIGIREVTVDHIIPLSRGGPDCADNVICSCKPCNELKRDRTVEEFRALIAGASYNLMQKSPEYRAAIRFGFIREYRKPATFYFERKEGRICKKKKR